MSSSTGELRSLSDDGRQLSTELESPPEWMADSMLVGIDAVERGRVARNTCCSSTSVEITGTEIRKDSSKKASFVTYILTVSNASDKWKVKRRYTDFVYLHQQLKGIELSDKLPSLPPKKFIGNSLDPSFIQHRKRALQAYISALVVNPALWIGNELVFFLDGESKPLLFLWNVDRMRRVQDMLNAMTIDDRGELSREMVTAQNQVKELQDKVAQLEMFFFQHATGKAAKNLSESKLRSLSGGDDPGFSTDLTQTQGEASEELKRLRAGGDVLPEDEAATNVAEVTSALHAAVAGRQKIKDKYSERKILEVLDLATGDTLQKNSITKDVLRRKSDDEVENLALSWQLQETMRLSKELLLPSDTSTSTGRSSQDTIRSSDSFGSPQNLKMPELSDHIVGEIDNLILGLAPSEEVLKLRENVVDFVKGLALVTHRSLAYTTGWDVRDAFTVQGELDITLCLSRRQYVRPFVKLNEALCTVASNQSFEETEQHEGGHHIGFMIERVSYSFLNAVEKCKANMNGVSVDISANQIRKLVESIFLENIDKAVGKNHLFHRSLYLLKAWFSFEAPKYTNSADISVFGESSSKLSSWCLSVMMILIFNIFGKKIYHPFQALGVFLEYYDALDIESSAITIHGPTPCDTPAEVSAVDIKPFFDPDLLASPRQQLAGLVIAAFRSIKADKEYEEKLASGMLDLDLSDQEHLENEDELVVGEIIVSNDDDSDESAEHAHPFIPSFRSEARKFKKGFINLMDPLEPNLNLTRHVDTFCATSIKYLIQAGARAYSEFLLNNIEENKPISDFFQFASVYVQHKQVGTASFFDSKCDEFESSLEIMQLILCSVPSLGGLARLIVYILEQRGPLPVGEVGKQLLEFTGSDLLVKNIKQRYGGLKKVIEMHENLFSLGLEHPFNPTVSLKDNFEPTPFPMKHVEVEGGSNSPVISTNKTSFLPLTKADSNPKDEKNKSNTSETTASITPSPLPPALTIPADDGGKKSKGKDGQRSRGNSNLSEDNNAKGGGNYSPRKARNNRKFKGNYFPYGGTTAGGGSNSRYPQQMQIPYDQMNMHRMYGNQQFHMMPPQVAMYPLYNFSSQFYDASGPVNLNGAKFYDAPPNDRATEKK